MKVVEIFNSIEGEGKRAGLPCTFIRLHGCNLKCSYCDSQYACSGKDFSIMSIQQIIETVESIGCKHITITGGEPLIHSGIDELIEELLALDFYINVETNGSIQPRVRHSHLFYTIDFKTISSGMSDKMEPSAFENLEFTDVVKFVVGSEQDLEQALEIAETYNNFNHAQIFVSPIFGKIKPKKIVEFIRSHLLWDWKVQLQLHKYIWNPDKKGV